MNENILVIIQFRMAFVWELILLINFIIIEYILSQSLVFADWFQTTLYTWVTSWRNFGRIRRWSPGRTVIMGHSSGWTAVRHRGGLRIQQYSMWRSIVWSAIDYFWRWRTRQSSRTDLDMRWYGAWGLSMQTMGSWDHGTRSGYREH